MIDANEANEQQEIRDYNPDRLLNVLLENLRLKNDAALARMLEVAAPVISKIRHRRLAVGGALLIRMHEASGLSVTDLRYLMGDRRRKFRISVVQGRPKMAELRVVTWPAVENANELTV